MNLEELKRDCAVKQKRGLHFIMASVVIWIGVLLTYASDMPILTKNLVAFCCTAPLVPLAFFISKIIKVDFQNRSNPLTSLGIIFSVNQILYLLIAMWIFNAVPDKMIMVIAIIFGAHLLPYGWMYDSKAYFALSVIIPIGALIVGLHFAPHILALAMVVVEILFCIALIIENNKSDIIIPK